MKTSEKNVSRKSEYFVYVPSEAAQKTFFYPICTGNFIYEPGYRLERESYDSFLLMFIQRGTLTRNMTGKLKTQSQEILYYLTATDLTFIIQIRDGKVCGYILTDRSQEHIMNLLPENSVIYSHFPHRIQSLIKWPHYTEHSFAALLQRRL